MALAPKLEAPRRKTRGTRLKPVALRQKNSRHSPKNSCHSCLNSWHPPKNPWHSHKTSQHSNATHVSAEHCISKSNRPDDVRKRLETITPKRPAGGLDSMGTRSRSAVGAGGRPERAERPERGAAGRSLSGRLDGARRPSAFGVQRRSPQ